MRILSTNRTDKRKYIWKFCPLGKQEKAYDINGLITHADILKTLILMKTSHILYGGQVIKETPTKQSIEDARNKIISSLLFPSGGHFQ